MQACTHAYIYPIPCAGPVWWHVHSPRLEPQCSELHCQWHQQRESSPLLQSHCGPSQAEGNMGVREYSRGERAAEEPWLPQENECKYVCDRGYVRTYVHTFAVRCLDLRTYVHTLYSSCCRTMRTYVPWGVLYTTMVSHIRTYISKVFHQTGT